MNVNNSGIGFEEARENLLAGERITRFDWNPQGVWLAVGEDPSQITRHAPDGETAWAPTADDLAAEDWQVLAPGEG